MFEQKINLNSATAEELAHLPGIGPTLAERIIAYRETVHPFEEPAQIAAVSGIGERTYTTIADQLAVGPAEESPASRVEDLGETGEEEEGAPEGSEVQEAPVPPGESISKAGPDLEELVSEERWPEAGEETPGMPGEGQSGDEELPKAELNEESESEGEEQPTVEGVAVEAQPSQEAPAEEHGLPASSPERVAPSRSLWSRLSWLWTAMLGGFLGMVFTLVVFAGLNGSLDIARSRAVLSIESRIDGLVADVDALQGDVAGLHGRLDALEGLTARMDEVESAVDDLRAETTDLSGRTEVLEEDVATVSEDVEVMSDAVATLEEQAGQTRDFFIGLRTMLNDVFGDVEERSTPPTSESK
jgi:competence ComEA-like helix-hairpin-helix protein